MSQSVKAATFHREPWAPLPGIFPKLRAIGIQTCLRFHVLLCLVLLACEPAKAPHLVTASGVASTRVVEGEAIELRGHGFPEGRPATLVFRGELLRAGRPVERRFELTVPAQAISSHVVAAKVTRELERAFCGTETPKHTTFRGALEATFTPRDHTSPPVTGGLPHVVLDFVPSHVERATLERERADGERFARFAGLLLDESTSVPLVTGVMPDSAGERAGVLSGDQLLELGGVSLLSAGDLVPPPRARHVELRVRRARMAEPVPLVLDVSGFAPIGPSALGPALGMLSAALLLVLFLRSPLGSVLSYLERCAAELLRAERERQELRGSRARPKSAQTRRKLSVSLPAGFLTYSALIPASALVIELGLRRPLVALELDVVVAFAASWMALFVASLLFVVPRRRGALSRVVQALLVFGQSVPFGLALAGVWLDWGSLSVYDAMLAQGALPWQWYALSTPVGVFGALVCVASLVPENEPWAPNYPAADARQRRASVLGGVGFLHLFVCCGITALVFFGGTKLPGVPANLSTSLFADAAGALLLLSKTLALFCFVLGVRALLSRVDVEEVKGISLKMLAPFSLALLGLALGLRVTGLGAMPREVSASVGVSLFAGALVLSAFAFRRVRAALAARPDEGVNPWI